MQIQEDAMGAAPAEAAVAAPGGAEATVENEGGVGENNDGGDEDDPSPVEVITPRNSIWEFPSYPILQELCHM